MRAPSWGHSVRHGPQRCGCQREAGACCSTCGNGLHRPGWGVAAWWSGGGQPLCLGLPLGKAPPHRHQDPAGHRTQLKAEPGCRGAGKTARLHGRLARSVPPLGGCTQHQGTQHSKKAEVASMCMGLATRRAHAFSVSSLWDKANITTVRDLGMGNGTKTTGGRDATVGTAASDKQGCADSCDRKVPWRCWSCACSQPGWSGGRAEARDLAACLNRQSWDATQRPGCRALPLIFWLILSVHGPITLVPA